MLKVILIRHAETDWNARGIIQGHKDTALTELGHLQTSALLEELSQKNYPVECIYASPLGRTWSMGKILAEHFHCSLVAESALKEQAFGQFEGISSAQFSQFHQSEAKALFNLDAEYCPPGGESLMHATQRFINFLTNLENLKRYNTVSIVSHGHVSQGVLAMLSNGIIEEFPRYAHPNASYSVFDINNGKCEAIKWGIATHLRNLK